MITHRTKVQLAIFALITLLGVSYTGAHYARLDRLFLHDHYTVVAHFTSSGGIYTGGEVSYRGVEIGQVGDMRLTRNGVDVDLDIDNSYDEVPADALAVVGNRSAVGEQYVELQPQSDSAPYLRDGSQIVAADTRTPTPTEKLLADAADTVSSVNPADLTTTVAELGTAFAGSSRDLQRILDTTTSFVQAADDNFDVTSALIRDGNTVLGSQVASEGAIGTFARQLSLFSGTLAGDDVDLRRLIANGAAGAQELEAFLQANKVDLTELLSESVTTGGIVLRHLPGLRQVLVLYPHVVESGFTVLAKDSAGHYDAHFGLVLTSAKLCKKGYEGTRRRAPQDGSNRAMNTGARCAEPISESNARGAQNLDRPAPGGSSEEPPVVAAYDSTTGYLHWGDPRRASTTSGTDTTGRDTWQWLYLQASSAR